MTACTSSRPSAGPCAGLKYHVIGAHALQRTGRPAPSARTNECGPPGVLVGTNHPVVPIHKPPPAGGTAIDVTSWSGPPGMVGLGPTRAMAEWGPTRTSPLMVTATRP